MGKAFYLKSVDEADIWTAGDVRQNEGRAVRYDGCCRP